MKNPNGVVFPKNICPYNERFQHGFVSLGKNECKRRGIDYILIVDENMTETQNKMTEKMAHYELNHLKLGYQRMHRQPGAGVPPNPDAPPRRGVVGVTFLPPNFFKENPNIVIVDSYYSSK